MCAIYCVIRYKGRKKIFRVSSLDPSLFSCKRIHTFNTAAAMPVYTYCLSYTTIRHNCGTKQTIKA